MVHLGSNLEVVACSTDFDVVLDEDTRTAFFNDKEGAKDNVLTDCKKNEQERTSSIAALTHEFYEEREHLYHVVNGLLPNSFFSINDFKKSRISEDFQSGSPPIDATANVFKQFFKQRAPIFKLI